MLRISLRNLLVNKLRLVLTLMAATVGVSLVSGTFVLSDTMVKAFDDLYGSLTSGTDVVVKSRAAYESEVTTTNGLVRPMDDDILDDIRQVPGVDVAEGAVAGFALVVDKAGDPVQPAGAPTLGVSVTADTELAGGMNYRQGRAPTGPEQMALDAQTADRAGFRLGDEVDVVLQGGQRTYTLVAILGFDETDSLLGATLVGFDLPTAQQAFDKVGVLDEVDIRASDGVSADDLRDRIAATLPRGVEALTGSQVAADGTQAVRDSMGIFTTVLLVFAGVSVLVGSLVIWNSFNVVVAQRRREVALLRAVGATRRQVLIGVVLEATGVGLVAGAVGLLLGVGLATGIRWLLALAGTEIPSTGPALELRTVVVAFAVGLVVTVVAALAPAWSATGVSPMEALRGAAPTHTRVGRFRRTAGWAVTGAGLVVLVSCIVAGNQRWWTLIGTAATFVGLVVAGPALARAMARLVDHGPRGGPWRMAARNIDRSSRRAAATALALTLGLTVVVAVAVTSASLKESVSDAVSGGNRADLILEPLGMGLGVSPSVAELLRDREDVSDVVELRESAVQVDGRDSLVTALDSDGLGNVLDLGLEEGSIDALEKGTMLISTTDADDLGVGVGDTLTLTFPETGALRVRVVGTFSRGALINASYVVSMTDFVANVTSKLDGAVFVNAASGTDPEDLQESLKSALADYPNVEVNDPATITAQARASVDQLLGIVTALLLLAVVVAILGIVNTLVLSVVERSRELSLIRAVGGTRRQVRTLIRRESVLMSMLGALLGLGLGTVAGIALSRALADEGITAVSVPAISLVIYVAVAAGVGALAAIGPARRASRVDILRAIAAE